MFFDTDTCTQAWRSPNQGRNNAAYRNNREGIYATPSSRAFRDEEGKSFWVEIEIVDKYRYPSGSQAPYNVTVNSFHILGPSCILLKSHQFFLLHCDTGKLVGSW